VPVHEIGRDGDGLPFFVMKRLSGTSLAALLGQASQQRLLRALADVCLAIELAHTRGIVHRDLKPDNIMVARNRDGSDCVKVVDFGIAKAADNASQKVTKTGLVVGTPEYMSPEQLAGDKLDGRSDIYALALVAFNMLTGRLPFPASTAQESMIMRLTEPPRKLAEMRPEVAWSPEVQAALDRALERDANARFATAGEFGSALSQALQRMETPVASRGTAGTRAAGQGPKAAEEPAIPATRVRGPAAAQSSAPTSGMQVPAAPRRHRGVSVALGAGGLIVIGVLATAMVLQRKGTDQQPGNVTTPVQGPSKMSPGRDSTRYSARTDSVPAKAEPVSGRVVVAGAPTIDIPAKLDSLEKVVSGDATPAQAAGVLRELQQMRGRINGNDQLVHAAIVRAFAEGSRKNNAAACAALRGVRSIAPGTRWAHQVEGGLSGCD
jgi:protein kinase-like protein